MKKAIKISATIIGVIVFSYSLILFWRYMGERSLTNQGNELVKKIELYKKKYKKLPLTLDEVGRDNHSDDTLFFYLKRKDSVNYIIWYGTSLGESKIYYSDSQKWEDGNR